MKVLITLMLLLMVCMYANAQIIYTDVNPDSVINGSYNLDLNNDGISDFKFNTNSVGSQGSCHIVNFGVSALNTDSIILAEFALNEKIGDTTIWNHPTSLNNLRNCRCQRDLDNGSYIISCTGFATSGDWYLPLKIIVNNLVYYGWARFSESALGGSGSLTIKDYAYNSIPNQPILAGEIGSIVPLNLLNFDGILKNNAAVLIWATANEINNNGFAIEKSADGKNFFSIGFIKGKENISSINHYNFIDADLKSGNNFYRLKQVDNNGKFSYSVIREVNYQNTNVSQIVIAPNPVFYSTTISITLSQSQKVSISIFDVAGKLVTTFANSELSQGIHQFVWNTVNEKGNAISSGVYFLKIQTGYDIETRKLVIEK